MVWVIGATRWSQTSSDDGRTRGYGSGRGQSYGVDYSFG